MCLEHRAILLSQSAGGASLYSSYGSRDCLPGVSDGLPEHGPCRLLLRRHLVQGLLRGEGCQDTRS